MEPASSATPLGTNRSRGTFNITASTRSSLMPRALDLVFHHSLACGQRRVLARLRGEAAGPRPVGVSHDEQAEHDKAEFHDLSDLCDRKEKSATGMGAPPRWSRSAPLTDSPAAVAP